MAPLPAALAAPMAAPPKGGSAGAPPSGESKSFGQLLGPSDGTPSVAGAAGAAASAAGHSASGSGELPSESLDPAAEDALAAMGPFQAAAPEAPWPPTGLGGLFLGSPFQGGAGMAAETGTDAHSAVGLPGRGRNGLQGPASGAALSALQPPPGAPGASMTGAGAALPAATLADAAFAAAAESVEVDATAVGAAAPLRDAGGEAEAPAFTLPQLPAATAREPAPMLAAPLPTPNVRNGDFSERFGAQLHWMAGQNIGHARIQVTPHDLGPVEVMLRMDGDSISAEFVSAHAETRQALEQGLPRLRDLLGEHGFQLAHAGVGADASPSRDGGEAPGAGRPAGPDADAGTHAGNGEPATVRTLRGLVDAYA